MIQGLLVLRYGDSYVFRAWHGTLLYYAITAIGLLINTWLGRFLPKFESAALFIHIFGFLCILIPLVYFGPHGSASDVFAKISDSGGWEIDGLSFFIGTTTSMFTFLGMFLTSRRV